MTCLDGKIDTCLRIQALGCVGCPHYKYVDKSHVYEQIHETFINDVQLATTDKLEYMFKKQKELQERLGVFHVAKSSDVMTQHYIDKMLLAIHEEAVEIGRETISKSVDMPFGWKHNCHGTEENYRKEIIDLWHFTMNLWLIIGGTPKEFFEMYLEKNKENHVRQEGY
jgi:hypothetical protein